MAKLARTGRGQQKEYRQCRVDAIINELKYYYARRLGDDDSHDPNSTLSYSQKLEICRGMCRKVGIEQEGNLESYVRALQKLGSLYIPDFIDAGRLGNTVNSWTRETLDKHTQVPRHAIDQKLAKAGNGFLGFLMKRLSRTGKARETRKKRKSSKRRYRKDGNLVDKHPATN